MKTGSGLQTPLVVSMLLLIPYVSSYGRPRRRFCESKAARQTDRVVRVMMGDMCSEGYLLPAMHALQPFLTEHLGFNAAKNYPFAPRCLGVAAKRSLEYDVSNRASPMDIYSTLLRRIYDEAKRSKQSVSAGDQSNLLLDDQSLFDKLAALVDKSRPDPFDTDAYTDGADNWNDRFNDNERGI